MSSLSDRYVWAVLRAVPVDQRADLEPEILALVGDAVAARQANGMPDPTAEREALIELGDPEVLAAGYTNRTLSLLGPSVYLPWKRTLTIVLPLATTIGVLVAVIGAALAGREVSGLVGVGITAAIGVAVQTAFWITIVFVAIERFARTELEHGKWTPDALPDVPAAGARDVTDFVSTVATAAVTLGLLVWQQVARPVVIDGVAHPLFDEAVWTPWLVLIAAVLLGEMALAVISFVTGEWTRAHAAVYAGLSLAFAVPAVWLLQTGRLLDPGLVASISGAGAGEGLRITLTIISIGIVAVTAWEIVDGFLRARRGELRVAGRRTRGERNGRKVHA